MADLHRTRGEAIEGKPRPVPPLGVPSSEGEAGALSPSDALRVEHDLIRRVIHAMGRSLHRLEGEERVDLMLIQRMVDFLETYAHRVHHGKEEEILFRELHEKALEPPFRRTMEELAREHVEMRDLVGDLTEGLDAYLDGDEDGRTAMREALSGVMEVYPEHIEREEEDFFPEVEAYLEEREVRAVLEAMAGHDRAMIHEKYGSLAEDLAARTEDWELPE